MVRQRARNGIGGLTQPAGGHPITGGDVSMLRLPFRTASSSLVLILWLVLLSLFVACDDSGVESPAAVSGSPPSQEETPDEEKVLTILYWQAPSLPNPYLSGGFKDRDAGAITLEPLAKYAPDGDLVPALAADTPTIENGGLSQDLTSITWRLKEGLKWSDGSDMTADDVVFTWRYCVDEDTGCTSESSFDGIASMEAPDELTVKITFAAPTPYPYNAFVGTGTPIISRAQFAGCVGAAATTCEAQNTVPLGTGPYRITGFKTNDEASYERNSFYRGRRRTSTGSSSRVAAMRFRRHAPSWKKAKPITRGTCKSSRRLSPRWRRPDWAKWSWPLPAW